VTLVSALSFLQCFDTVRYQEGYAAKYLCYLPWKVLVLLQKKWRQPRRTRYPSFTLKWLLKWTW